MSTHWHDVLLKLGSMGYPVYANWSMSNGSEFLFAIPPATMVEDDSFSSAVEFPFTFGEIREIEVFRAIGSGACELTNNLEEVYVKISATPGLTITAGPDRITISEK